VGAFGYQTFGVVITLLFASTLLIVAMPNLVRDLRLMLRKHQKFHF
jgi:competence protein ComGC